MSALYKTSHVSRISDEGKLIFKQANLRGLFVQIIDYFYFFKKCARDKQGLKKKNESAQTFCRYLEAYARPIRPPLCL